MPTGTTTITTTPSYDPNGSTITQTTWMADSMAPGVVATHAYTDAYNAADWTASSGDDGKVVSYGYDANGQTRTQTQNDPTTITTTLDGGNARRPSARRWGAWGRTRARLATPPTTCRSRPR